MATRRTIYKLKNNQTNNGALPTSGVQMGEPLVNLYNGIVFFSGTTGGDFTQSGLNDTYFEVGSNLYNLKIRNQITAYSGVTGAGLVDKFLRGTSTGFVLDDISNIAGIDSYVTGATWSPNTLTLTLNNGKPSVPVTINSFNNLTLYGTTTVNGNLTVTGTTTLNGPSYYNSTATASNEIVNYGTLTSYTQTNDVYVTGSTLTPATNTTDTQTSTLSYHGTPIGGPYTIVTENTFTTGGTYSNSTKLITLTRNDAVQYTVDLSAIDVNDTYVTGGTNTSSTNNTNSASIGLKYNQDIPDGTYSLPYTDTYVTGGTYNAGTITFTKNDSTTFNVTGLLSNDTYVTGFTYNATNNALTISQNQGQPDLVAYINTLSGLTVSNLTAGQVVYVGSDGKLKTDSTGEFAYNDTTNVLTLGTTSGNLVVNNGLSDGPATFGQGGVTIGSGGSHLTPGIGDLIVHGNFIVFGTGTTVATNELYVEDPQITLNYNPTDDTSLTSVASGIRVQNGAGISSGVTSGDTYFTIARMDTLTGIDPGNTPSVAEYTGSVGYTNRGWLTQLNDIVIRNNNLNNGAPNGVRVLAEFDILDGGIY